MSDSTTDFPPLEDFSASSNTNLDSDPTADLLAREQAILGVDAALFSNSTNNTVTSTTSNELEAFPDITLSSALDPSVNNVNTASDYSAFHSEFPPVEIESTQVSIYILRRIFV